MNRQWLYARQPKGKITPDTFQWRPEALIGLFDGSNRGKRAVRVS